MSVLTIDSDTPLRAIGLAYFECQDALESKPEHELFHLLAMRALQVVMSIPPARIQLEPQRPLLQYRIDILGTFGTRQIAFEADGLAYHADQTAFARDRKRDRDLAAAGIETYRWTANEIFHHDREVSAELWRIFLVAFGHQPT